jgi:hypothetical protein
VVLRLPADMYRHENAPTEWWWHTGTLKAGNRTFGFEINAASFVSRGYGFSQIMLSDVERDKHYQRSAPYALGTFDVNTWAEADTAKPWYARLGQEGNHLSAIEVTNGGSGYTGNALCVIEGGGGKEAVAFAQYYEKTGKIIGVAILSAGRFPDSILRSSSTHRSIARNSRSSRRAASTKASARARARSSFNRSQAPRGMNRRFDAERAGSGATVRRSVPRIGHTGPRLSQRARSLMTSARTRAPAARSADVADSASLWLIPSLHGTKIMPVGHTACRKRAS